VIKILKGVNLSNIIQDFTLNDETGEPILIETVNALKDHCSGKKILTDDELIKNLDVLLTELKKVFQKNCACFLKKKKF